MQIACPHGYSSKTKAKNITFEFCDVNIYADICDYADRCGIKHCEFYDITKEGTRRFHDGLRQAQTLEGMLEDREKEKRYRKRRISIN